MAHDRVPSGTGLTQSFGVCKVARVWVRVTPLLVCAGVVFRDRQLRGCVGYTIFEERVFSRDVNEAVTGAVDKVVFVFFPAKFYISTPFSPKK